MVLFRIFVEAKENIIYEVCKSYQWLRTSMGCKGA